MVRKKKKTKKVSEEIPTEPCVSWVSDQEWGCLSQFPCVIISQSFDCSDYSLLPYIYFVAVGRRLSTKPRLDLNLLRSLGYSVTQNPALASYMLGL